MRSHRLVSLSSNSGTAGKLLLGGLLLGGLGLAGLLAEGCSFSLSERAVCTDMGCVPVNNDKPDLRMPQPPPPDLAMYVDDPSKAGPFQVASKDQTLPNNIGMAGDKVTLLLPSDNGTELSTKSTSYPMVVILPARSQFAEQLKMYGERLASHGFIAALARVSNEGNHDQYRTSIAQALFYLTGDAGSTYKANIDKSKIGVLGHQLGGKIAFGLLLNNGMSIQAAFGLDPVNDPGNFDALQDLANVDVNGRKPIGLLGEPLSKVPPSMLTACAPADRNYEKFYEAYKGSAVSITFPGATLPDFAMNYVDPTCGMAMMPVQTTQQLAVKYTTAYFQWTLLSKQRAREHLLGADFDLDKTAYSLTNQSK